MTGNHAADSGGNDQPFEHDRPGLHAEGLVVELQDGNSGEGGEQTVEVLHAEEHGHGVEPRRHEADGDGSHDGDRDHPLGPMNLLRHVCGTVEAGKGPIRVDQANDKGDAVRSPAGVVDEVGEDEFGFLMSGRLGRDDDHDDEEGDQRGVKRSAGNGGENLAVAIEDEREGIDDLISYEHVPGQNHAEAGSVKRHNLNGTSNVQVRVS